MSEEVASEKGLGEFRWWFECCGMCVVRVVAQRGRCVVRVVVKRMGIERKVEEMGWFI